MSKLWQLKKYGQYLLKAQGISYIHSPFVYQLCQEVIYDTRDYYALNDIEILRNKLLNNRTIITVEDYGAGSKVHTASQRSIGSIAKNAGTPPKKGNLLFRLSNYWQAQNTLELGTSLGLGTLYLAWGNRQGKVHTIEGCKACYQLAKHHCQVMKLNNVHCYNGQFKQILPKLLHNLPTLDLAYIDGHHTHEATLAYFNQLLPFVNENSCIIFDDIYWSKGMEKAWKAICVHPATRVSINLFQLGLIFFRKENKQKQHFVLRW